MKIRRGFAATELVAVFGVMFGLLVAFLAFAGYVFNIIALAGMDFATITGMHVIRIIGVFMPPVGSFAGWFL